ncbi:hypothetical protein [Ruminococcus sp.]|uniref:hypothetical protein n=1 Tax=Ruminococcus sp. TaxID=41978 RepID=UPI0025DC1EDE|nr:hypothetical protein [Ruminococcus sp.]
MKSYEEISNRIMQRGDEIIASRRKRSEKIKRTSFVISGMCAVLIVGIGIKHTLFYKKPHNAFSDNSISITQETTGDITTSLPGNVTSADHNSDPANNTTQTVVSDSVVTTISTDTETTVSNTNINETTETQTDIITTDEAYTTSETITAVSTVTTGTSVPAVVTKTTVTTPSPNGISTTSRITTTRRTTSSNRVVTTIKTTVTETRTITSSSFTTARSETIVSGGTVTIYTQPVTTDTRIDVSSRRTYVVINKKYKDDQGFVSNKKADKKDNAYYVSNNSVVPEEKIGKYIGKSYILSYDDNKIEEVVKVYKIKNVDEDEAVAILIPGSDVYYRFNWSKLFN